MELDNSIEKTLVELQKLMNTNSIVGNPISTKDKVIIPVSKTALGFGVGAKTGNNDKGSDIGGAGGGGSIDPVALLILYNDIPGPEGVELVRLDNADTSIDDLLSGIGKTVFNLLGSRSSSKKSTSVESPSNVDKIKTKIKPGNDSKKDA